MKIGTQLNLRLLTLNPAPDFEIFSPKLPFLVKFGLKLTDVLFSIKGGMQCLEVDPRCC